jgi:hypothetical protein
LTGITQPERLFDRATVLAKPCPVPATAGAYAWFFREAPPGVPLDGCMRHDGKWLLYVGISPRESLIPGRVSTQTLRKRIRYHYRGNAEGSTLRLTLGCLLSPVLGIELRRVGSGQRMTFGRSGEDHLSEWMAANAFVAWQPIEAPWLLEEQLIRELSLPLNLQQNSRHPFHKRLSAIRSAARERARTLPVLTE